MTDEEIARAHAARRLLGDETAIKALDAVAESFISMIKASAIGQSSEREAAYQMYCATLKVKSELQKWDGALKIHEAAKKTAEKNP